jgi:hypothetical protein
LSIEADAGVARTAPDVYEVEFLDSKEVTIAVTELQRTELLLLQHEPVMAS